MLPLGDWNGPASAVPAEARTSAATAGSRRWNRRRSHLARQRSAGGAQNPPSRTSALAIRPAAIISRTEGTRTRATTSWIFGAARAARSSTARRCSRRRAVAWRRSWSASGEPKRRERSIAAQRPATSPPGARARSPASARRAAGPTRPRRPRSPAPRRAAHSPCGRPRRSRPPGCVRRWSRRRAGPWHPGARATSARRRRRSRRARIASGTTKPASRQGDGDEPGEPARGGRGRQQRRAGRRPSRGGDPGAGAAAHPSTLESRLIARSRRTCIAAASPREHGRGRSAQHPDQEPGLDQLGEERPAARHRDDEQAGEARLGSRGASRPRRPGRARRPPAAKRRRRPARSPPESRWLRTAAANESTLAERIRRRQASIAAPVGAPRSSSAPSRASSTAGGPSRDAAAAGKEARSVRPAVSESAIATATDGSARSTAAR